MLKTKMARLFWGMQAAFCTNEGTLTFSIKLKLTTELHLAVNDSANADKKSAATKQLYPTVRWG